MQGRKAIVTVQDITGAGSGEDFYAIVKSAQLRAEKGRVLSPATFGEDPAGYAETPILFYQVLVERIVGDRVGFTYRNLVIRGPDGINLSAPPSGSFILRAGESIKLATPVLDAGATVVVTLDEIR